MQRTLTALALAVCATVIATNADAATINVSIGALGEINFAESLDASTGNLVENPDGTFHWTGSVNDAAGWDFSWDLDLDPDPTVSGVVAATNHTNSEGTFMFQVNLPVTVGLPAGSSMFGSSSVTINDANNSGSASLSAPVGGAIYEAQISGTPEATLFDDPYSLSPAFPPTTAADTAGFSGTTSTPLNVGDVMSIKHTLVISGRDSATANSNFTVIPEPASVVLVAIAGLLGCAAYRRRRCI